MVPLPLQVLSLGADSSEPHDLDRRLVAAAADTRQAIVDWADSIKIQLGDFDIVHLANQASGFSVDPSAEAETRQLETAAASRTAGHSGSCAALVEL